MTLDTQDSEEEKRDESEDGARIAEEGLQKSDSNQLDWRQDHREYPLNWVTWRKALDTTILFSFQFFCTIFATSGPSTALLARIEYGLSRTVSMVAFSFMYSIGQAIGGLIMPPFSECFGRRRPYIYASASFSIGCLLVGVVPHSSGAFIGRFISGAASAVPSVVPAGSIHDIHSGRSRVWVILLWNSSTTLGLITGPVFGSYISFYIGW